MSRIAKIFPYLLLSPVVLPLVICGGLYYPYLFPKVILFYVAALLSLAAFVYLASRGAEFYFARLKSWVTWIPALLLILAYATSLFGIDFYKSFWSIFGRGDGLLQLTLSTVCFYLILISADELFFRRFTRSVAVVGTIVAAWGLIEWMITGGRIGGSLGNPAFLAAYLAFAVFITLVAARTVSRTWRGWVIAGAALQLVVIILTETRGAMLALFLAAVVAVIYYSIRGTGKARGWSIAVLAALLVLASTFYFFRGSLAHSSISSVARIAQISTSDPNTANRLFAWKHMLEEIGKRPLAGYGAEHIAYLFDRFYDPQVITEEWFDRSHNAYLDYAAQFGVLGVILYLALIISLIAAAIRYMKKDKSAGVLFGLAALTYAAQNFFLFDTVSIWWLFLATLAVLLAQKEGVSKTSLSALRMPVSATILGAVLVLCIIPVSVLPLLANRDLYAGYYNDVIDVPLANKYFNSGLSLHTYGDLEYGYQLHTMYTDEQTVRLSGEPRIAAYEMVKGILTRNYERYPYDARTAVYLASVLDAAPPEKPADPELVRAVSARALELSPNRRQTWYVLANLSIGPAKELLVGPEKTARYQEAIATLQKYIALVPALSEPHYVLADLYMAIGDSTHSRAEAALGKQYYKEDLLTAERAALYYERQEEWKDAAFFLQEVVDHDNEAFTFYYDLAKVEYLLGNYVRAEEIVQDLRVRNPEILSTDPAFMNAMAVYEQSLK